MRTLSIEGMAKIQGGMPVPDCSEIFEAIFTEPNQSEWIDLFFYLDCHTSDWEPID